MTEFLKLKKSNCKNCYKCIRNCPVKSIRFSAGQAHIVSNECVLCGQCFVICPQNAKGIVNDVEKVKVLLAGEQPVYASLAPSFIANYDGIGIEAMERALRRYNGKPLIHSVNGKEESLNAILPLVKKYGGGLVCLALDDDGIPETVEGRVAIAQKIIRRAEELGIPRR